MCSRIICHPCSDRHEARHVLGLCDRHTLKPVSKHYYAMDVTGNWLIIFRFEQGDAYDVELIDYH